MVDLWNRIIRLAIKWRMGWSGPEYLRAEHLGNCCRSRQVTRMAWSSMVAVELETETWAALSEVWSANWSWFGSYNQPIMREVQKRKGESRDLETLTAIRCHWIVFWYCWDVFIAFYRSVGPEHSKSGKIKGALSLCLVPLPQPRAPPVFSLDTAAASSPVAPMSSTG